MPKYFQSYSVLAKKFLLKIIKLLLALKINYVPARYVRIRIILKHPHPPHRQSIFRIKQKKMPTT